MPFAHSVDDFAAAAFSFPAEPPPPPPTFAAASARSFSALALSPPLSTAAKSGTVSVAPPFPLPPPDAPPASASIASSLAYNAANFGGSKSSEPPPPPPPHDASLASASSSLDWSSSYAPPGNLRSSFISLARSTRANLSRNVRRCSITLEMGRNGCQFRRRSRGCSITAPGTTPDSFGRTRLTRGG